MDEHCRHDGTHSGIGHYSRALGAIRFVVVCDACGSERHELTRQPYEPQFVAVPAKHTESRRAA
jgi:hypothetical protein